MKHTEGDCKMKSEREGDGWMEGWRKFNIVRDRRETAGEVAVNSDRSLSLKEDEYGFK